MTKKNSRINNKKNQKIIILIIVLLLFNALAFSLLIVRTNRSIKDKNIQSGILIRKLLEASFSDISDVISSECGDILAAVHIYSHRGGAAGREEENSIPAYDYAVSCGSVNIEQDVVTSAEGTLYVSHNLSAAMMTGTGRLYSEMKDSEIDALTTYGGNHIARLSEVFDRYGDSVYYIIEIKENSSTAADSFVDIVNEYGYKDRIIVQSLYLNVLESLESVFPEMKKLYVCMSQADINTGLASDCVDIIGARINYMTDANCDAAHSRGKEFNVWTLVNEDQIRSAIDVGADTYFADDTEMAFRVEKEYRQKQNQ